MISIVNCQTNRVWIGKLASKEPQKRVGRLRTPDAIRELELKIAQETRWGYTRILGELRKLGYQSISRQTVVNILKSEGIVPRPRRGANSWDAMLRRRSGAINSGFKLSAIARWRFSADPLRFAAYVESSDGRIAISCFCIFVGNIQ